MSKKTLLIQPIQGKFVQSTINGKTIRVWLVDPDTNSQGTEILYKDAIAMLALPHPVVCPAQIKGKDGKFVQILDDEDLALIAKTKDDYLNGEPSVPEKPSNDTSALNEVIRMQAETIKTQGDQMSAMQQMMVAMQQQFAELKESVGTSGATKKSKAKDNSETKDNSEVKE